MAIDFTLTSPQRELQLESRRFAVEVLAGARAAELLPTAEERFLATRPVYEAMVVGGFLRKCIPQPAGGENAGLIDMAIMAEEFYSVNASVTLTMLGTVLGLLPNFTATAGSSMAGRNGSPRRPGGIVKVRISYAWFSGPRPTLHPRKRFPSSRSNARHRVSSSSAQSSPWGTARISRRNSGGA